MRKSAEVTIGETVFTVREVKVGQLIEVFEPSGGGDAISFFDRIKTILPDLIGQDIEAVFDLYPSEVEELYEKLREVNLTFFACIGRMEKVTKQPLLSLFT
jgi:hypothetical protein